MFKTVRCPYCGGDVVLEVDAPHQPVIDFYHVTPACPMFSTHTYDENAKKLLQA